MRRSVISRRLIAFVLTPSLALLAFWSTHSTAGAVAQGPPFCATPPTGLVSWWPLDGSPADIQGNNPASLFGNPSFTAGKVSQALQFDGSDDHARVPASASLNVGTGNGLTLDAWINPADVSSSHAVFEWNDGISAGVHMWIAISFGGASGPANLYVNLIDTSGVHHIISSAPGVMTLNTWQHVAATYDKTTGLATLFRNGIVVAQQNLGIFTPRTNTDLYFGMRPPGTFRYAGLMDEVEIFNRALSQTEIQTIVNADTAGKCRTCTPPPSGMLAWWPGEGNANNLQGSNHGTLQGNTTFVPGKVGQAFSLDGNGDYVSIPDSPSFNVLTTALTIDAWIKVNSFPNTHSTIIAKGDTSWRLQRAANANTIRFGSNHPGFHDLDGNVSVNDGQWHHVAAVFDGTTKFLYIDGLLDASAPVSGSISTNTFEVSIGENAEAVGRYWDGQVDEVEIFSRALSASEIQSIANAGNAGKCYPFSLVPDNASFPGNVGTGTPALEGSFNVTVPTGFDWTAVSNDPGFITITGGSSGTGGGPVSYMLSPNPSDTTRRIGTITAAGLTFTVLQGPQFLDVPVDHLFYTFIGKLAARGVTLGCGGGNYCPEANVTREQMAAFIIRARGEFNPPTPVTQRFDDVPPTHIFYNHIERMAVLQVTLGCSAAPPLYCPSDLVLREQMAAFVIRGLGELNPPTPAMQRFDDVPPSHIFYNHIDRMAVLGITLGCNASPPLYCPSEVVTRGQMGAFLVRAFQL